MNYGVLQGVFAVPNCVVDQHIKLAGAIQLKVLLLLLRGSGQTVSEAELAKRIGYSEADVRDAVIYWQEAGVLSPASERPAEREQGPQPGAVYVRKTMVQPPPEPPVQEQDNIKRLTASYRFTQKEAFSRVEQSDELKFIIEQCRVLLGRELQGSDVAALVSIHDWAGLSPDVILLAASYCASRGYTDMRSVERQCTAWLDRGIRTHEQADDYIKQQTLRHSREAMVQGAFGITGRKLSTKERESIARWFDEYGYDIPIIRAAFDKTVDNTGKLSFAYLDRILSNWYGKGVRTLEQAMAESADKPKRSARATSLDLDAIENEGIYDTPKL